MNLAIRSFCALCIPLCCCSSDGPPTQAPAPETEGSADDDPFPTREVVEISLELAPEDWDVIRAEGRTLNSVYSGCRERDFSYTTVEARLRMGDRSLGRVSLRKKGNLGSLSTYKPSLRIELDAFAPEQRRFGSKTLVLNNSRQDLSFTHQCMAYAAFRAAGIAAPSCGFARVEVNGEVLGSYVLVEPIKKPFLKRHFGDDSGALFEGTGADFTENRLAGFEPKNEDDASSDLLQRVAEALAEPASDLPTRLENLIDLPSFLRFWATETLIGHWDGYSGDSNNFYVYVQPASGKLAFIPWGTDGAFEHDHLFLPEEGRPRSVYAVARLPRRLYEHPEMREMYRATLRELVTEHWDETALLAEVDRIAELVDGADPTALERQRAFIRARRSELLAELDGEAPRWPYDEWPYPPCRKEANTELTASFEVAWGTLGAGSSSPSNAFELTLDGQHRRYGPTLASAGFATPERGGGPAIQLVAPQPDGRAIVVVLYVGARPLVAGEILMHGVETYGVVVDSAGADRYDFKGFIGDGAVTFDEVGTSAGAMVRGRLEAQLVSLPPAFAAVLSEP